MQSMPVRKAAIPVVLLIPNLSLQQRSRPLVIETGSILKQGFRTIHHHYKGKDPR